MKIIHIINGLNNGGAELNLFNVQKQIRLISNNNNNNNNINYHLINILDDQKISKVFLDNRIDIVIHAAAYKHVELLENQPEIAFENNYYSTKCLYDISKKNEVSNFLFISTDKAVRPTSIMGVTKRLAELYCLGEKIEKTKVSIVRFGNVIDSSGSVLPIFIDQILKNIPVTVTHKKVNRFFMSIEQASKLVLEANSFNNNSIYHLDMGDPQNIYQLAINLIKLHGFNPVYSLNEKKDPYSRLIKITGLKSGEKLYEELLVDKKKQPTKNKNIYESIEEINHEKIAKLIKKTNHYLTTPNSSLLKEILSDGLIKYRIIN